MPSDTKATPGPLMSYKGPLSISCNVSLPLPVSELSFNSFFFSITFSSFFSAGGAGGICATQNLGYCLWIFINSIALTKTMVELSRSTGKKYHRNAQMC